MKLGLDTYNEPGQIVVVLLHQPIELQENVVAMLVDVLQ